MLSDLQGTRALPEEVVVWAKLEAEVWKELRAL